MTAHGAPLMLALLTAALPLHADTYGDPLAPWRNGVKLNAVSPEKPRHTIHSYFNTCPESPDGRFVLFYSSTARDGHRGEVCIRDRTTGEERTVAGNINAEDAHRVACQQWVSGGRRVVFHGERDGQWSTWCVDLDTMTERLLARGQLAGWGQPNEWGVVLTDVRGTGQIILHQFDNSQGAQSWRRSHPHPVFSANGKRIYYHVSSGPWTQLYVAERP